MKQKQNARPLSRKELAYWALSILLVLSGAGAPVGFGLISFWLMGRRAGQNHLAEQEREPLGARTNGSNGGSGAAAALADLARQGRRQALAGGLFLALALVSTGMEAAATAALWNDPLLLYGHLLAPLCVGGIALGCLLAGFSRLRRVGRFRRCLAQLGRTPDVSVAELARAAALSPRQTRTALTELLALGILPQGHLDRENDRLVLTGRRNERGPS